MMIAVVLLLIDRALKAFAWGHETMSAPLVGETVRFELFKNTGSIFSLPVPSLVMILLSGSIFLLFLVFLIRLRTAYPERTFGMTLIVLGAASNLYDRIAHGAVIDYLLFFGRSAINIADVMIVAGVLMLVVKDRVSRT